MQVLSVITATVVALVVAAAGLVAVPLVFAERVLPGLYVGNISLAGLASEDLAGALRGYNEELQQRELTLQLREKSHTLTLGQLGVTIDVSATINDIANHSWLRVVQGKRVVPPHLTIDRSVLETQIATTFASVIKAPRNASLTITPQGALALVAGQPGEGVDTAAFSEAITAHIARQGSGEAIVLTLATHEPDVLDSEVETARLFASQLLRDGLTLTAPDDSWHMPAFTVRRLLAFVPVANPQDPTNRILGVTLNPAGLAEYLSTTIVPEYNREPENARFERNAEGIVTQFAVPLSGREVNFEQSVADINASVAAGTTTAAIAVAIKEPTVNTAADIEALGITTLLATGESSFAGSPANRIHNIKVGTSRYHGLLIPPESEFSFNEHLGPVDGVHGFKPELVIKHNVTTPEFGGGLCQVSTTAFRAAVRSGLKISQRRNHAYAVRYYGTPGFDATIYPPYTDLRFINNTPGYILIQARVEGMDVTFEFWGTDDGRQVEVAGPNPYARQANGAVKATLTQKVTTADAEVSEDTFYSNYRSPDLFPRAVSTNDPSATTAAPAPSPTATPTPNVAKPKKPTATPTATPTAAPTGDE